MKIILLIDFGSTFTKVTAVDLHKEILLGCASSFTTIDSDINIGLKNAIKKLEKEIGKIPDLQALHPQYSHLPEKKSLLYLMYLRKTLISFEEIQELQWKAFADKNVDVLYPFIISFQIQSKKAH